MAKRCLLWNKSTLLMLEGCKHQDERIVPGVKTHSDMKIENEY